MLLNDLQAYPYVSFDKFHLFVCTVTCTSTGTVLYSSAKFPIFPIYKD